MTVQRASRKGASNDDPTLLAYFGHHKCGTQWMNSILQAVCDIVGREMAVYAGPRRFGGDLAARITDPGATFLCYINADRRYIKDLGALRGFHMVRDPRDIVVSAYYSHLHSHPEYGNLSQYRERLQSVSKDEGVMLEIDNRVHEFRMMLDWDYERDDIFELRMEDVTSDAHRAVPEILSFIGLASDERLDERRVARIIDSNDFTAKAGRPPGTEDVKSHYRKGVAGDWIEHFTDDHIAYFKQRYNDLLLKLGYETSPDWQPATRV